MGEQREREHKDREQRPVAEPTGEVADADLEQAAAGILTSSNTYQGATVIRTDTKTRN